MKGSRGVTVDMRRDGKSGQNFAKDLFILIGLSMYNRFL